MYSSSSAPNFCRTPSTGSIDGPLLSPSGPEQNSSQNTDCSVSTDDDDSDSHKSASSSYKERRREAHTQAEQKRRDAIKKGYEDLQHLVPTCQQQDSVSSYKLSKATILQRSIDYIRVLQSEKDKNDKELSELRNEATALEIMKSTSEDMVKQYQQTQTHSGRNPSQIISDDVKIQVFEALSDHLFRSFDGQVSTESFAQLSQHIFVWLEENCKPQTLRQTTGAILTQLKNTQHP